MRVLWCSNKLPVGRSSGPFAAQAVNSLLALGISRTHFDPDRRTDEAERFADGVLKEALIGEVQLDVAVREEDKSGRRNGSLCEVEDAHTLRHRHRSAFEIDVLEEAVHLSRWDTLATFARDQFDLRPDLLNASTLLG